LGKLGVREEQVYILPGDCLVCPAYQGSRRFDQGLCANRPPMGLDQ